MSILTSRQGSLSAMEEDTIAVEHLDELQEVIARLQLIVCELLEKNQQLRFRGADE